MSEADNQSSGAVMVGGRSCCFGVESAGRKAVAPVEGESVILVAQQEVLAAAGVADQSAETGKTLSNLVFGKHFAAVAAAGTILIARKIADLLPWAVPVFESLVAAVAPVLYSVAAAEAVAAEVAVQV